MAETLKEIKNRLGVSIIKADDDKVEGASAQLPDPFEDLYETEGLIEPPYSLEALVKLPEQSNILQPIIDAYKTNIAGFGYSFNYKVDMESSDIDSKVKERATKEWLGLESFYANCNYDKTFNQLVEDMLDDRERMGIGYLEVILNGKGVPGSLENVPGHTIRMSKPHKDIQKIPVIGLGLEGKSVKIIFAKKFRKYCQVKGSTSEKVWFKEFGDPRRMHMDTGVFEMETNEKGEEVKTEIPPEKEATSIMAFPIYVSYTPYGIPRWMGNALGIYGSRKAEELNYNYFINGKHVPMAILVKNGSLTTSSLDVLKDYASSVRGSDNSHAWLIIEAESLDDSQGFDDKKSTVVDIEMKPLTEILQQDALFQTYDKNNRDRVRANYRLPPIYTGESQDYTRATADTARSIAEEQIFQPERDQLANKFNRTFNPSFGVLYLDIYFKGPNLTNKLELAQAINIYEKTGALTPNMLIKAVSELLAIEFERITEPWGNKPMRLTIAELSKGLTLPEVGDDPTPVIEDSDGSDIK